MSEYNHEKLAFSINSETAKQIKNMQDETLRKLEECGVNKRAIQESEYEWVEVLVPSHLYIPIRQIIETFLDSHNANDGNGGWNKLKGKQNDN